MKTQDSTYNKCFHGVIRKQSVPFGEKKPYLELSRRKQSILIFNGMKKKTTAIYWKSEYINQVISTKKKKRVKKKA